MTFRGHVQSLSLDEVFALVAGNALDGTLVLSTERASVQLYFHDGALILPRWITHLDARATATSFGRRTSPPTCWGPARCGSTPRR